MIKRDNIKSLIALTFYNFNACIIDDRYDETKFKDLLIDSEIVTLSTDEMKQFRALQKLMSVKLKDIISFNFEFEIVQISFIEIIKLETSLDAVIFHIIIVNSLFLLRLIDMNRMRAHFNNVINETIQSSIKRRHSVIRRCEHAFLLWDISSFFVIIEFFDDDTCFLIDIKLRRLHKQFDHLSVRHLHAILTRVEHEINISVLNHLIKHCHHC
jgi:hypothetical protein